MTASAGAAAAAHEGLAAAVRGETARAQAAIVIVSREAAARQILQRELSKRYGADYQVVACGRPAELEAWIRDLRKAGLPVALVIGGVGGQDRDGVEVLAAVRAIDPTALRVAAVRWGDWESVRSVFDAVTVGTLDRWVTCPVQAPDEEFHRSVTEFLREWSSGRGGGFEAARVIGERWSARSQELRDLFARYRVPAGFYDATTGRGRQMLGDLGLASPDLPVVVLRFGAGRPALVNPSNRQIADAFGVMTPVSAGEVFDLAVIGAGPAGLAAAVYASSEGLRTVVAEHEAVGGQAGTSSMIRNYPGFSQGISGARLAQEMWQQAWTFGTTFRYMRQAQDLSSQDGRYRLRLSDGGVLTARTIIIATGATYQRLGIPHLEDLQGRGVFYGAAASEAPAMRGRNVFVAGGGNSAGQTALHLARWARRVTILVRAKSLADSMSDYLIRQIGSAPNIDVCYRVQVAGGTGTSHLQSLVLQDTVSAARRSVPADALFVLIGSQPRTQWLAGSVARDRRGFILTGPDLPAGTRWPPGRPPLPLETSLPGVFAAGDVRRGSVNRVASAVGEGAATIPLVHRYLHTTAAGRRGPVTPHWPAYPRPGLRQQSGERPHAHRAQRDRHPTGQEAGNGADHDRRLRAGIVVSSASGRGHRRRHHAGTADDDRAARPRGCGRVPNEARGRDSSHGRRCADRPAGRHHHRGRRRPRHRGRERRQRRLGRCRDDHSPGAHHHDQHPSRSQDHDGQAFPSPARRRRRRPSRSG